MRRSTSWRPRSRWTRSAGMLICLLLSLGCDDLSEYLAPVSMDRQPAGVEPAEASPDEPGVRVPRAALRDEITVASWNIQVLGKSKISKPEVMRTIVDVVRRFDVIAVQELRSRDQSVIDQFLAMVNQEGYRYEVVVGPRLGRTHSKEQYLYLYDTQRIELLEGSVYTIPDPSDRLHREPLVASFRVIGALSGNPWTFTLVNIHTDPDEVSVEVDALDDVIRLVRDYDAEDDVILLGDLNADERHLGDLADLPNLMWTVTGQPTNTRRSKSYDNILFSGSSTTEFTGAAGIIDLEEEYALNREEALAVSDHLPIWAAFAPVEQTAVAGVPANGAR